MSRIFSRPYMATRLLSAFGPCSADSSNDSVMPQSKVLRGVAAFMISEVNKHHQNHQPGNNYRTFRLHRMQLLLSSRVPYLEQ